MSELRHPLAPGSVIGVLGGGQLGRMLAGAAAPLGLRTHVFCQDPGEPAAQVTNLVTVAPFDDLDAVRAFATACDVVTTEFENVPLEALHAAMECGPVAPGPLALKVAQDRLSEKTFVANLGIPVAPYAKVDSLDDLESAVEAIGAPGILKTRRLGYDGKGQVRVLPGDDLAVAVEDLAGAAAIYEGFVDFDHEISAIVARDRSGAVVAYDPPRNDHRNGILHTSTVPSQTPGRRAAQAIEHATTIAEALDYVGVLAVEFFVVDGAALVVNEMAPRVHNSGHWTIDACSTSQFENHMRAVSGWPLGSTDRHSDATMTNLIGDEIDGLTIWAKRNDVAVHHYGKAEARPGRKMGHVTELR
ncbi:MAG: 5-(carboxyamino)imidazole ribonucleotide synthase [Actinomycetota bacterium]